MHSTTICPDSILTKKFFFSLNSLRVTRVSIIGCVRLPSYSGTQAFFFIYLKNLRYNLHITMYQFMVYNLLL